MAEDRRELTRTLLAAIFLGGLIVASLWILRPFLAATIWATMIVVATWPVLLWFQARLWQRRWLAILAMTVVLLLVFAIPLTLSIGTVVLNAEEILTWLTSMAVFRMPTAPAWIAHLPFIGPKLALAWELTAVVALLCIAQVGPSPVLVPAVIWLYWDGETAWGTFLLVWTVGVVTIDNVLRPVLIKRGADLPLLLILAGVVGGLLAFGLAGVFVGPVVLAVSYTLLRAWIADDRPVPP